MKNAASAVAADIDLLLRVSAEAEAAERRAAEVRQAAEVELRDGLTEAEVEWLRFDRDRWSKDVRAVVQAAEVSSAEPPKPAEVIEATARLKNIGKGDML